MATVNEQIDGDGQTGGADRAPEASHVPDLRFPKNQDERRLLVEYAAEDAA